MSGRNPIMYPIHTMAGAEWNILDDSGCRIAWCGYDGDHEKSGPPIAAELVKAVNDCQHYKNRERQLTEDCNSKYEQIRDLEARLAEQAREYDKELARAEDFRSVVLKELRLEENAPTIDVTVAIDNLERLRDACEWLRENGYDEYLKRIEVCVPSSVVRRILAALADCQSSDKAAKKGGATTCD